MPRVDAATALLELFTLSTDRGAGDGDAAVTAVMTPTVTRAEASCDVVTPSAAASAGDVANDAESAPDAEAVSSAEATAAAIAVVPLPPLAIAAARMGEAAAAASAP